MRVILKCMCVYDLDGFRKHKIPQICILSGAQYSILSTVVEDAILCVQIWTVIWYRDLLQRRAGSQNRIIRSIGCTEVQCRWEMDLSELRYIACESIGDRLYTFGDGQCFQIRKVEKGVCVDPDYRHAIDRVRCGNICISSGIFGDDDLTIIGDFVFIVLDRSMHCIRGRGN